MQKRIILFSLMLFVCIFPAAAGNMNITLIGDEFYLGQTVQAEVEMDDFSVTKISLLGGSGNRLGASFFSQPYKDGYLAYFMFPPSLEAGNYSLFVSDRVVEDGVLRFPNASAFFSVKKPGSAFAVSPAIIRLSSKTGSFRIELRHTYGETAEVAISSPDAALKPARQSITVPPGDAKSLFADYKDFNEDSAIMLKSGNISYAIPVLAFKEPAAEPNVTLQNETGVPGFENALQVIGNVSSITRKVKQDIIIAGPVSFKNAHALPLHNIIFSASGVPGVEFNISKVPVLMPGETLAQHIWINRKKDAAPGKYEGRIKAESDEGAEARIRLVIEFEALEAPAPAEPGKKNITVTESPASLNISFNYSEVQQKTEKERMKSLRIAVILTAAVLLLIILLALKLKPKVKYRKMQEYAKGLGKG